MRIQVGGRWRAAGLRCSSGSDSGMFAESQWRRRSVWFPRDVVGTELDRNSAFLLRLGDPRDTTTHPLLGLLDGKLFARRGRRISHVASPEG